MRPWIELCDPVDTTIPIIAALGGAAARPIDIAP
jgi:hypothetical protein